MSVLLLTEPHTRRFAALDGSPLEQWADVLHLAWDEREDRAAYRSRFDAALPDARALIVSPWSWHCVPELTEERWARAEQLQVIAGTFDNRFPAGLDVADAARRGVVVVDTSRSMTPTVAEFALAMTLNLLRDIPAALQLVREGRWKSPEPWDQEGFVHGELSGRRVGVAGYGGIGRRYAELLEPFACPIAAYDPFVADEDLRSAGVQRVGSLADLAARSEILLVGIPRTPATEQIVGREVIGTLPRGALIVIVTRMAVVDQTALWERAEAGEIRAAVDVFDPEPPPADASFRTSPHVLPTPHIAGSITAAHRRCFTTACEDALAVLAGRKPRYRASVEDDRLYRGVAG